MKKYTDIVFINPPLSLEQRYGHLAPGGSIMPPIGLAYLASEARREGFSVRILDAAALCLSEEDTAREIMALNPRIAGFTAATVSVHCAANVAGRIKQINPDIITLIGGPHLTALPERTMELFGGFDIGVIGEGERTVVELLRTLDGTKRKSALSHVRGLILREEARLTRTDIRPYIENLDTLSSPAWDLLPEISRYYRPSILRGYCLPATGIVTSRGCVGQCTFCARSVFGSAIRAHSAEYVVSQMEELHYRYSIREIFLFDDNIMLLGKRLERMCAMLIQKNMKLRWSCFARIDSASSDMLELMKRAGCRLIAYGVESGNQVILTSLKKHITLEEIRQVVRLTKKAGIRAEGLFMMGLPGETRQSMRDTADFARALPLDDIAITVYTPMPGSALYGEIGRYGSFEEDWRKMSQHYPVFVPRGLTSGEIIKWNNKGLRIFYLRLCKVPDLIGRAGNLRYLSAFIYAGIMFVLRLIGSGGYSRKCRS